MANEVRTMTVSDENSVIRKWWSAYRMIVGGASLDWLASGRAPFVLDHRAWDVTASLGAIRNPRVEHNLLLADVMFSNRPLAQEVLRDIDDKLLSSVSVGFNISKVTRLKTPEHSGVELLVDQWEPFEVSLVLSPADRAAFIHELSRPVRTQSSLLSRGGPRSRGQALPRGGDPRRTARANPRRSRRCAPKAAGAYTAIFTGAFH